MSFIKKDINKFNWYELEKLKNNQKLNDLFAENFSSKKKRFFVADFETTNSNNAEVYSWGIITENGNYRDGIDISTFFEELFALTKKEKKKSTQIVYFLNGSKFDNFFILPYLFNNYKEHFSINLNEIETYNEELLEMTYDKSVLLYKNMNVLMEKLLKKKEVNKNKILELIKLQNTFLDITGEEFFMLHPKEKFYYFKSLFKENWVYANYLKSSKLANGEFSYLLDGRNTLYQIKFKWKEVIYVFNDYNLLFQGSVKNKGEFLNKHFETNYLSKRGLDSGYLRDKKYKSYAAFNNDGNEREYLFFDCLIPMIDIILKDSNFKRNYWKMTIASTAHSNWRYGFFGDKLFKKAKEKGIVEIKADKKGMENYRFNWSKGSFCGLKTFKDRLINQYLPKLENRNEFFKWYMGALVSPSPNWSGVWLNKVAKIDIKSSYPSVMNSNRLFPYGEPIKGEVYNKMPYMYEARKYNYLYYKITAITDLINEKGVPFLGYGNVKPNIIKRGTVFFIQTPELKRMEYYYQGSFKKEVEWAFRSLPAERFFKEYVEYYYDKKNNSDGVEKLIAKLFLNSNYGKFGEKSIRVSKRIVKDNLNFISYETNNELLDYYVPIANAITMYGRLKIVDAVGENYETVAEIDTDSVALPNRLVNNFDLDDKKLGFWDIENDNLSGIVRGKKQYLFNYIDKKGNKKSNMAFAGIKVDKENFLFVKDITEKEFIFGKKIDNQLTPHFTPLGKRLENTEKFINPLFHKETFKTRNALNVWFSEKIEPVWIDITVSGEKKTINLNEYKYYLRNIDNKKEAWASLCKNYIWKKPPKFNDF